MQSRMLNSYSKSNITTLMADGQKPEKDRNLNNGEYDSTPLDLDGDGTPDINSSATRSSVISSFQRYAELLNRLPGLTIPRIFENLKLLMSVLLV